jgi:hypothetical protein
MTARFHQGSSDWCWMVPGVGAVVWDVCAERAVPKLPKVNPAMMANTAVS